ncbi:MAG: Z1 domain-containing protein [Actinomycetota bacterium]|nr:Z1 domain-containing protein [Actinomycetota bacterium]
MTSAGDRARLENDLYVVRAIMDRHGIGVEEALERARSLIAQEDHQAIVELWHAQTSTTITVLEPAELSEGGPRPWAREWDSSKGYYWPRQQAFLRHVLHRADFEIDSLDRSSDRVLAHLEDPNFSKSFNVRGLVIGYVQSGKTANFSALIAKAVDAGYKVVIVLSGLHNTLRQQTQYRLQRDLGHEDTPGVGPPEPTHVWVWMTGAEISGDFNPAGQNAGVLAGNNRVILVVKKNKSRLDRLINWMRNKVPPDVPVLVIDDEADLASINTGGNRSAFERAGFEPDEDQTDLTSDDVDGEFTPDEVDPSAINLRVRQLLQLFARCSYVAYTATPFANVLIDPGAIDREGGQDLFPRDFIISLPKPPGTGYVGTERLFGRDQLPGDASEDIEGLDVIEIIPDHEVQLLVPPRRSHESPTVPPSLQQALRDYLLASAAWLNRAQRDVPCTMLVHTDMRKALQDAIADEIEAELASLRQAWKYDEARSLRADLAARWEHHFRPRCAALSLSWDTPFEEIEPYLDRLLSDGVAVRRLNSNHLDTADFEQEPTLKAILVGGNKLSRGVTIEGLLISYYVRLAPYYDTLLQMGRWFGYRGEYVDISRLYSTQLLVSWFHDLATAEEDLRRQIELYDKRRMTPLQFAPRIRSHPVMLVTAQNKMRDAREITQSYDGELVQTLRFPFGDPRLLEHLQENLEYTRQMVSSLGPPPIVDNGRPAWTDVGVDFVQEFLDSFWVMEQTAIHPPTVRSYIHAQTQQGELARWRVLVSAQRNPKEALGREDLGIEGFPKVGLINRSRLAKDPTSLGVITSPDDELFGLSQEDIARADEAFADRLFPTRGKAYRAQRDPGEGLLILYPISGNSVPGKNAHNRVALFSEGEERCTVLGLALSFPFSDSPATVTYLRGPESSRQ